jgi:menaquinol-cytochrome c reductase iron-sulfur subunit
VLIARRIFDARARAVTTVMDWVLLADLLLQVAAGFYIALFHRWGTLWYQFTAAPWIASLFSLEPKIDMITPLPWIVRFHMVNAFVVIGLFPFTRLVHIFTCPVSYLWRPYQIAIWNREAGTRPERAAGGGGGPSAGPRPESRRSFFMKAAVGTLAAIGGLLLAIPYVRVIFRAEPAGKTTWSEVADLGALPPGQPVNVDFQAVSQQAYLHGRIVRSVWVIRHPGGQVTVFSPICPHLGCDYTWNAKAGQFQCPCHGSIFTPDGKVIGGPAPRPLDTLPYRIENNILFVQWQEFRVAIPQKVRI